LQGYQEALDNVVLPRFGKRWIGEIETQEIADLIRELSERGLSLSTIRNYLKPLNGSLSYAVRKRLLGMNPYDALSADDWPRAPERRTYEWSDSEIDALLEAALELGSRKNAQDYYGILFGAVNTGLRLGELLGLRWQDLELPEEGPAVLHVRCRRSWVVTGLPLSWVKPLPSCSLARFLAGSKPPRCTARCVRGLP